MEEDDVLPTRTSYLPDIWAVISSVGWYVLGAGIVLFFASPYLEERYQKWKNKKDEKEYETKLKKDPDLAAERLRSIEAARQRMQSKYNETVEEATRRKEEEKAKKMEELLQYDNGSGGQRLGGNDTGPSTSKLRNNDYNPLMGDTGRGYRAPKRSACRGGGCGGS